MANHYNMLKLNDIIIHIATFRYQVLYPHHEIADISAVFRRAFLGLGLLGILHGLLLPTRWVQVETLDPASEPILIHALRKKSARGMVKFLREKMRRQ